MRLLVAPLTVASTLALFGTGVLLVVMQPQRGFVVGLHKASFVVWFGAMAIHVLGHVLEAAGAPPRSTATATLPARGCGQFLIAAALVVGVGRGDRRLCPLPTTGPTGLPAIITTTVSAAAARGAW